VEYGFVHRGTQPHGQVLALRIRCDGYRARTRVYRVSGRLDWAVCKRDLSPPKTATAVARHGVWYEEFTYPSEVAFVANRYGTREDNGVLISNVDDSRRRENCLLVLHTHTMEELARAYTGVGLCVKPFVLVVSPFSPRSHLSMVPHF
jgi:Retinal pigment epithelial membrane protein